VPIYNPPPNWPRTPPGWSPPTGWRPPREWGPAPAGWRFWLPDQPASSASWFGRHKVLTVLGGVVALIVLLSVIGGGSEEPSAGPGATISSGAVASADRAPSDPSSTGASSNAAKPKKPTLPVVGDKVRDKRLQFTVEKIKCGVKKIGGAYFNTRAQGQFCLVTVTVKNIGDDPETFSGHNQILLNAKGQEYSSSTEAAIYLQDSKSLYEEINPGNRLKGQVVFDVPKTMEPSQIELHASAFSGGVMVSLR